jgi:hypothetical protein
VDTAEADCPERLNFDLRIPDLEQAALLAEAAEIFVESD